MGPLSSLSDQATWCHVIFKLQKWPKPVTATLSSPQNVDFTSRFKWKENKSVKLPQEDFETCNLIQWWFGQQARFPNLFRLAHDILAIPGKFSMLLLLKERSFSYLILS